MTLRARVDRITGLAAGTIAPAATLGGRLADRGWHVLFVSVVLLALGLAVAAFTLIAVLCGVLFGPMVAALGPTGLLLLIVIGLLSDQRRDGRRIASTCAARHRC